MRVEPIERHLLLEGILLKYGYDFRQYAEASLNRRLINLLQKFKTNSLLDILKLALMSPDNFHCILPALTINTTEFFRDPLFFKNLRDEIFPVLKTYPKLTVWVAGCSSGEEVISLSIALKEENLLSRTIIYATDINPDVLRTAREAIYPATSIQHFNRNYTLSGGTKSPSDYYATEYGLVRFHRDLLQNVVFTEHNLATDAVFAEAHLIICRNVLIYFTRELQNRALDLFTRSLIFKGYLGLGSKESLRFSSVNPFFTPVNAGNRLYTLRSRAITHLQPQLLGAP